LPITPEDLRTRQALAGHQDPTCPWEASITFGIPSQQRDGRILLHVIEEGAAPKQAVEHLYFFRCNDASCRLERDDQLEEGYTRLCPL
jgi:hypothetical protein